MEKIENPSPDERCSFCFSAVNNPLRYGEMYRYENIITHYFCILMSTGIKQNGNDDEGLYGFLIKDIHQGLDRARDIKCVYCKRGGATAQCNHYVRSMRKKCLATFHLTCGVTHGSQHLFYGQYQSMCHLHRRAQKIPAEFIKESAVSCGVCFDTIHDVIASSSLWGSCCKNYYFHRDCVQQLAFTSGGYHFRCPLCNNADQFRLAMQKCGIYVPIRDALWETEPDAYSELYVEHNQCDVEPCLCPHSTTEGDKRTYNSGAWDLIRCASCGSEGTHRRCSGLSLTGDVTWNCGSCQAVLKRKQEDGEGERDEIQKTIEPDTCCAYYCVSNKGRDYQTDKGMYKTIYCMECELSWIHARCRTIETNGVEKGSSSEWTCVGCLAGENEDSTEPTPTTSTTSQTILSSADKTAIEEKTKKQRGRRRKPKLKNDAQDPLLPSGSSTDSASTSRISEPTSSFSSPASSISNEEISAKLVDLNKKQKRRVSRKPRPTSTPSPLISSTPPHPSPSLLTSPTTPDTASISQALGSSKPGPKSSRLNASSNGSNSNKTSTSRKQSRRGKRISLSTRGLSTRRQTAASSVLSSPSVTTASQALPETPPELSTPTKSSSTFLPPPLSPPFETTSSPFSATSLPETPPELSTPTKSSSSTFLLPPPLSPPFETTSPFSTTSSLPATAIASTSVSSNSIKDSTTHSSLKAVKASDNLSNKSKVSAKSRKPSVPRKDTLATALKAPLKIGKSLKPSFDGLPMEGLSEAGKRKLFSNVLDVYVKQYHSEKNENDFYRYYLSSLINQLQLPGLKYLYYQARLKLNDLPKANNQLTSIDQRGTSTPSVIAKAKIQLASMERTRTFNPSPSQGPAEDARNRPGDIVEKAVEKTPGVTELPSKEVNRKLPMLMRQIVESIKRARLAFQLSKQNVKTDIQMDMVSSTSESVPAPSSSPPGPNAPTTSQTGDDTKDIICLSSDDEEDDECMVVDEEQTQTIIPKDEDIEVLDAKLSFSWMVTGFKDVPIQVVSIHEVDNLPWVMGEPKCSDYKPLPEEISTKNLEFKYKDDLGNVKTDNQVPTVHSSYIIPSSSSSVISPQPTPTPPSQPRFIIIRPVNPPPIARTNAIRLTSCPTPIRFPSRDVINSVQLVSPGVRDGQNGISRDVINSVQHNSPRVRDSQNGVSSDVTNDQNSVVETGVRRLSSDTRSRHISSDVTLVPSGDDGFMEEPPSPSIFKVTKIVGSLGLDPKSAQSTSHSASHQTNAAFTQGPLIKRRRYTHTPHIAASTNNFIHSTSVTKSPHAASSMNQVSNAASTSIGSAHATSNNPQSADPDIVSISDDEEDDDLIIIS